MQFRPLNCFYIYIRKSGGIIMSLVDGIVKHIPNREFGNRKIEDFVHWCGDLGPHHNRLFLGATALVTQPAIDLYNDKVDEKTRKVSCARTIAKIIAGAITGVSIRWGFLKLVRENSAITKTAEKTFKTFFTPSNVTKCTHAFKQYQNTMANFLAIVTMIGTNFLVDAPLTQLLTNRLTKGIDKNQHDGKEVLNG